MDTEIPHLHRGEAGFEQRVEDLVFNSIPLGRAPDVVASPRSEDEVVEIVRAARSAGQKVAVLSGGHNWIGASVHDRGVLIEMSAFDRIEIDPDARTARVGTAARSGAVADALAARNLAFPTGHCGLPGIGGFVLGGGFGLNVGRWKPACFSLRGVRVVTAAGELVVASESEHPELLWLARGAGPAFPGVVTELEIELQDRPADTRVSSWVFALDDLAAVSRWIGEVSPELPSNLEVAVIGLGPDRPEYPPGDGFPDHVVVVEAMAFVDDAEEAREAVAPLAAGPGFAPLGHSDLEPLPYEQIHTGFDAMCDENDRYLADTFWTDRDLEALTPLEEAIRRAPSGKSVVMAEMFGHGEKLGLTGEDAAYSIDGRTLVMAYAIWEDAASDDANRAWHAGVRDLLEPISIGHFVNEADLHADPERLSRCFTPANWERLVSLRGKWDPDGLFHDPPGSGSAGA
ncbi:MAG: FAD-binding oxidoreductase [Actinobacteria bacterium]|nr:FAD-binding oxidoreductase [Actinomycetota bacterium]